MSAGQGGLFGAGLTFFSPISPGAWAVLALVPAGIILLYFLKLKRHAVQVPSTLLWRRSLEDLHVNSPFQRLRRSLLLFLQLLMVGLAMFALAGPRSHGVEHAKQRLVLAIDESASMGATDVEPTRLAEALRRARATIERMEPGDLGMIIAFSNSARVVATYTEDRPLLLKRLETIKPTENSTSLREALQLVAGLANPQKYLELGEGVQTSEPVPPRLKVFTDGGFADVEGFSLGNIEPEVIPIGPPVDFEASSPGPDRSEGGDNDAEDATRSASPVVMRGPSSDNVAILALSTGRDEGAPDQFQIFGRVRNHRATDVSTRAILRRADPRRPGEPPALIDAVALEIPARSDQAFQFDLKFDADFGEFQVDLEVSDALELDNHAYAVASPPRRTRVLLVGANNRFLNDTLRTPATADLVDLESLTPEQARLPGFEQGLRGGRYDMVIFDQLRPPVLPEASALFLGVLPPDLPETSAQPVENPVVLDWDLGHPVLQYVRDIGTIAIRNAQVLDPPPGAQVLIESDKGPLAFARSRGPFVDVVLGFGILDGDRFNTNWPLKSGFPLFIYNTLHVLGKAVEPGSSDRQAYSTDEPQTLRPVAQPESIEILDFQGNTIETCQRNSSGTYVVSQARKAGLYQARWEGESDNRLVFAVNLFDARESNLAPRGQEPPGLTEEQAAPYRIKIGYTPVKASASNTDVNRDWWWLASLVALGVVMAEWVVYNRRIHT